MLRLHKTVAWPQQQCSGDIATSDSTALRTVAVPTRDSFANVNYATHQEVKQIPPDLVFSTHRVYERSIK